MENPHMYLLVFKKPSKSQVEIIRNTFFIFKYLISENLFCSGEDFFIAFR